MRKIITALLPDPNLRVQGGNRSYPRDPTLLPSYYNGLGRYLGRDAMQTLRATESWIPTKDIHIGITDKTVRNLIKNRMNGLHLTHHTPNKENLYKILAMKALVAKKQRGASIGRVNGINAVSDCTGNQLMSAMVGEDKSFRVFYKTDDSTNMGTSGSHCPTGDCITVVKRMMEDEDKIKQDITPIASSDPDDGFKIIDEEAFVETSLPAVAEYGDDLHSKLIAGLTLLQHRGALPSDFQFADLPLPELVGLHKEVLTEYMAKIGEQHFDTRPLKVAKRTCETISGEYDLLVKGSRACVDLLKKASLDQNADLDTVKRYAEEPSSRLSLRMGAAPE